MNEVGIPLKKIAKRWMKEPGFKAGYEALEEEFSLASMLIAARTRANLSQAELAEKMGTSQSTVARLESGAAKPSLSTLQRYAKATGARLKITLEPKKSRSKKERGRGSGVHGSSQPSQRSRAKPRQSKPQSR